MSTIKRTVVKESALLFLVNIVTIVIGFLTNIVLARSLSLEQFGMYQLALAYISLTQLLAMPGINTIITKGALKNQDYIFKLGMKKSITVSLIYTVVVSIIGWILFYLTVIKIEAAFLINIVGLFIMVSGLDKYDGVLQGKKKFLLSRRIIILQSLMILIAVGYTAFYTKSYIYALIAFLIIRIVIVLYGIFIAVGILQTMPINVVEADTLLKEGKKLGVVAWVSQAAAQLDKIILGQMDPKILAIYTIGCYIPKRVKDNLKTILAVPVAYVSSMKQETNLKIVYENIGKLFLAGVGVSLVLIIVSPWLIPVFYGDKYEEAIFVAQLYSVVLPMAATGVVILAYNIFQKRGGFNFKLQLFKHILCIVLLVILVPLWKSYGALAVVISIELIAGVATLLYLKKEMNRNKIKL